MRLGDSLCRADSCRDSNGRSRRHDRDGGDDKAAKQLACRKS
jgi:hypothetical protein